MFEAATCDVVGRLMFGSATRLRLGMWIAHLKGNPHTFTQRQFWDFCERVGWPEQNRSMLQHLKRFESMEMIKQRSDLARGRRAHFWTRLPSPMWSMFHVAAMSLADGAVVLPQEYVPSDARRDLAQRELLEIVASLKEGA